MASNSDNIKKVSKPSGKVKVVKTKPQKVKIGVQDTPKLANVSPIIKDKPTKKTLYIEADDEIAAVIDKVISLEEKVVAVVLPKYASVFQSVVNMKLLNRSATQAKKSLVLITSEPAIISIAGIAGVYVASTLTSKPEIPKVAQVSQQETTITAEDEDISVSNTDDTSVKAITSESDDADEDDTIQLDNTETMQDETLESDEAPKKLKFKIPNFSSFRLRMTLGILALFMLIIGWFVGFVVLPKVTITINTDNKSVEVSSDLIARAGITASEIEKGVLAATKVETAKEDSATVPATGKKDVGQKATGLITLTNCVKNESGVAVPAGSGFSSGSVTFVTTEAVQLGPAVYVGSNCISDDFPAFGAIKDVSVVAAVSGEAANLSARSYTSSISGVSAFGSVMSGGTSKIATVVSAEDIKKATDQITGSTTATAITDLKQKLNDKQLQPLDETLEESETKQTQSASQDTEASEVTVKRTVTYSMFGVSSEDMSKLLDAKIKELLTDKTQNIRSNGLSSTIYRLVEKISDTEFKLSLKTIATTGPEFDHNEIKQTVSGKELSSIKRAIEQREGVRSVDVEFSPFWVFKAPSSFDKIIIVINETQ